MVGTANDEDGLDEEHDWEESFLREDSAMLKWSDLHVRRISLVRYRIGDEGFYPPMFTDTLISGYELDLWTNNVRGRSIRGWIPPFTGSTLPHTPQINSPH